MNEPIAALYRFAMDENIYLRFMDDPDEYASNFSASTATHDRLRAQLDTSAQKLLDIFLDEKNTADSILLEAAFTAGLAFGLQLFRLL